MIILPSALHVACNKDLADMAALLVKYGADMNACNREGKTAFELLNSRFNEAIARIVFQEAVQQPDPRDLFEI